MGSNRQGQVGASRGKSGQVGASNDVGLRLVQYHKIRGVGVFNGCLNVRNLSI